MTPKQLAEEWGIDSKKIRKVARKQFGKPNGGTWNFTDEQVQVLKGVLTGAPTKPSQKVSATLAAPQIPAAPSTDWTTIEYLTEHAKTFLMDKYNLELEIPITFNGRLTLSLGRFKYYPNQNKPVNIELSKRLINHYDRETALDVLEHELIHYACFMLGKPYRDGDWYFENELKKHGVARTKTFKLKGLYHEYTCTSCGQLVARKPRKIKDDRLHLYTSKCCNAPIKYEGQKEI